MRARSRTGWLDVFSSSFPHGERSAHDAGGFHDTDLSVAAQHLPSVTWRAVDATCLWLIDLWCNLRHFTAVTAAHESQATTVISTIDYVLFFRVNLMNGGHWYSTIVTDCICLLILLFSPTFKRTNDPNLQSKLTICDIGSWVIICSQRFSSSGFFV